MPSREKLAEFIAWCAKHITGDEKGQAQIFLDRLFQSFGQSGSLDVGGTAEFRVRKSDEDGGGATFADYVWKPVVLIEMKKRGTDLQKHYRQAFDYWTQFSSAPAGPQKLAEGRRAAETPGPPFKTSAPRRRARTLSSALALCDPSGVVIHDSGSRGIVGAQPPATILHPSGMLSRDTIGKIDAVAAAARELRRVRADALPKIKGGLRALYRTLELPGANPLKDAHAALDTAVLTAYGFNANKDLLAQLLALNQEVAAKIEEGSPVTAPGVPQNYPDAKKLVTEDRVQAPETFTVRPKCRT